MCNNCDLSLEKVFQSTQEFLKFTNGRLYKTISCSSDALERDARLMPCSFEDCCDYNNTINIVSDHVFHWVYLHNISVIDDTIVIKPNKDLYYHAGFILKELK